MNFWDLSDRYRDICTNGVWGPVEQVRDQLTLWGGSSQKQNLKKCTLFFLFFYFAVVTLATEIMFEVVMDMVDMEANDLADMMVYMVMDLEFTDMTLPIGDSHGDDVIEVMEVVDMEVDKMADEVANMVNENG